MIHEKSTGRLRLLGMVGDGDNILQSVVDKHDILLGKLVGEVGLGNILYGIESPDTDVTTHAASVSAHHVKYTDANAIDAVEGEATLDLTGLIKFTLNNTTVQTDAEYIRGTATSGILAIDVRDSLIINIDTNANTSTARLKVRANASNTDLFGVSETGSVYILEKAAADADVAGEGQIWVKTASPNQLWFTRDDGTEIQLDLAGAASYASIAETDTGTEAAKSVTPDGLAGSNYGERTFDILVSDPGGDAITTGDSKAKVQIPSTMNGWNLVEVESSLSTVSSSGIPTVQIRRSRRASATSRTDVDMLSTKLTIDQSEFDSEDAATAAVVNGSNDDVNTGDHIYIDIDVAGTGAKGLSVRMTYRLP